jgi:hypothetical protein
MPGKRRYRLVSPSVAQESQCTDREIVVGSFERIATRAIERVDFRWTTTTAALAASCRRSKGCPFAYRYVSRGDEVIEVSTNGGSSETQLCGQRRRGRRTSFKECASDAGNGARKWLSGFHNTYVT